MSKLIAEHLPNVWAFSYELPSGSTVTLFRSVPGDTSPQMQIRLPNGELFGIGLPVVNPERYGSWDTLSEFEEWCLKFKDLID